MDRGKKYPLPFIIKAVRNLVTISIGEETLKFGEENQNRKDGSGAENKLEGN